MALPNVMPGSPLHERIELTPAQKAQRIEEIDVALRRSHLRTLAYRDAGDDRSVFIQEAVTDRLLRERFELQQ